MEYEKFEKTVGRSRMTFPNLKKMRIRICKSNHFTNLISVMSHTHDWEFFVKKGVIKIVGNSIKKGKKTFLIIPKDVIGKAGFSMEKDKKGYLIYRNMPNENTIYIYQDRKYSKEAK